MTPQTIEKIIKQSMQSIHDCCDGLIFKIKATEHDYIIPKYQWTNHVQLLEETVAESVIKILEELKSVKNVDLAYAYAFNGEYAEEAIDVALQNAHEQNSKIDQAIQLLKTYIN